MGSQGIPWYPKDIHGYPWISKDIWIPWDPRGAREAQNNSKNMRKNDANSKEPAAKKAKTRKGSAAAEALKMFKSVLKA